jgi:hypothetical protein
MHLPDQNNRPCGFRGTAGSRTGLNRGEASSSSVSLAPDFFTIWDKAFRVRVRATASRPARFPSACAIPPVKREFGMDAACSLTHGSCRQWHIVTLKVSNRPFTSILTHNDPAAARPPQGASIPDCLIRIGEVASIGGNPVYSRWFPNRGQLDLVADNTVGIGIRRARGDIRA